MPKFVRDPAYELFAHFRGPIWKAVRKVTGLGETRMEDFRDRVLGLDEEDMPLPPGWGFDDVERPQAKQ